MAPLLLSLLVVLAQVPDSGSAVDDRTELSAVRAAGFLSGMAFTDDEVELMLTQLAEQRETYAASRNRPIPSRTAPAHGFSALVTGVQRRAVAPAESVPAERWPLPAVTRPDDLRELLFADIPTLAALVRSRQVSCVELAELSLERLREVDRVLHCVISTTEERALARARELDEELAAGHWRGPLHGIPWGAKDLFAVRGTRTTWGAAPYEDQVIDLDATVVQRLDAAGAVLVAKLTLGALAYGDVWFGGRTRNPWAPLQGSSGSSAGSAAATVAGAVAFALGTETYGSIVSPSQQCGNSSLRPTFGRVSRHGAMPLVWSMDKVGPLCRSLRDAALVFDAIVGPDGIDDSVLDEPWSLPPLPDALAADEPLRGLRLGYPPGAFDGVEPGREALDALTALGAELVPIELPPFDGELLLLILSVEAATAFDELTRADRDDLLVRQDAQAWPNLFRAARLIPAVEYVRATRVRRSVMQAMDETMSRVDALVHPPYAGGVLTLTNFTGHPTVTLPAGFRENGTPFSVCFTGQLFDEARLLTVAHAWQTATGHHLRHPSLP